MKTISGISISPFFIQSIQIHYRSSIGLLTNHWYAFRVTMYKES